MCTVHVPAVFSITPLFSLMSVKRDVKLLRTTGCAIICRDKYQLCVSLISTSQDACPFLSSGWAQMCIPAKKVPVSHLSTLMKSHTHSQRSTHTRTLDTHPHKADTLCYFASKWGMTSYEKGRHRKINNFLWKLSIFYLIFCVYFKSLWSFQFL